MWGKKKENVFLELLIEAARNTLQGARMFREAMSGNEPPLRFFKPLKDLEEVGDGLIHQVFHGLNKVFITPLDREDIMELAVRIDDVMDGIEATISRFDYLNVTHTDKVMIDFADVLVESCEHILASFELLSQKKYMDINPLTVKINGLENEGDRLMREGIRDIFTNPKDPYHDFKLKEIYERLEQTTDACEDVADILDSMVLRYA
jgi:uncharacterized protein Yka (UPF0111/DUF47 family)